MSLIDILLRRPTAYRLRRDYDRVREKADKIKDISVRMEILRLLDQLEPSVVSLEEHHMSRFDKKRTSFYVRNNLKKVKTMLNESKEKEKLRKMEKQATDESYLKDSRQINR